MEWISVKDRLPEDNSYVLAFCNEGFIGDVYDYDPNEMPHVFTCEYCNGIWYCSHGEYYTVIARNVTHWMPLPEEPKVD